ncbi:MAG: acyl-CoA dehydrogenase family protein, partial [Actinomycetes bacterium]
MSIDFSLSPELEAIRIQVREFIDEVVRPAEQAIDENNRESLIAGIIKMRTEAKARNLWLPQMPKEWGGMGLSHVELAMVQAEA